MHVGSTLVADEQGLEVVEMREGSLDHPADSAQPGAMLGLAARDQRSDAELAERIAVTIRVVAAIAHDARRSSPRTADGARDRRDGLDKWEQLLDVVAVGASQAPGERDAACVDEKVVL